MYFILICRVFIIIVIIIIIIIIITIIVIIIVFIIYTLSGHYALQTTTQRHKPLRVQFIDTREDNSHLLILST